MIIDPITKHSTDRKRLVTCLVEWSGEVPILTALLKAGRADYKGIAILAHVVKATMDEQEGALDDRALACAVTGFLVDASVRAVVARYVGVAHGMPYDKAKDELYDLRVELVQQFHIKPGEVAMFIATEALVEEPAWVQRYREAEQDITPEGAAWLQGRPEAVKEVFLRLPPLSLVRSAEGSPLHFPAPGELAVVQTAFERDGDMVVGLSSMPGEPVVAEAKAEWLELVACCGRITAERAKEVLEAVPKEEAVH